MELLLKEKEKKNWTTNKSRGSIYGYWLTIKFVVEIVRACVRASERAVRATDIDKSTPRRMCAVDRGARLAI